MSTSTWRTLFKALLRQASLFEDGLVIRLPVGQSGWRGRAVAFFDNYRGKRTRLGYDWDRPLTEPPAILKDLLASIETQTACVAALNMMSELMQAHYQLSRLVQITKTGC